MIELPKRPIPRVMACFALLPHFSGMRIILGVTSNTCLRRTLIQLVGVTTLALGHLMTTEQRKRGAIVVDDDFRPALRDVATRAIRSELSAMRIFPGVTGHACHVQLFAMRIVLVATLATQWPMTSGQRETGQLRVVETDLLP